MKQIMFTENLKKLRKINKMTQSQLAEILNVEQSTVSAWENKLREPCFDIIAKICEIFDETFDDLIG